MHESAQFNYLHFLINYCTFFPLNIGENQESNGRESSGASAETDIEDLFKSKEHPTRDNEFCNSEFNCSGKSRENCQKLMQDYRSQTITGMKDFNQNVKSMRLTVLLILLLCSMFVVC